MSTNGNEGAKLYTTTVLLVLSLLASSCFCHAAVADHPKAFEGYRRCQPIIVAIAKYRVAAGEYPRGLQDLVPDFLESIPTEDDQTRLPFATYERDGKSYGLTFHFVTSAANHCTYKPEVGWRCESYM